jgi:integrase/recombinase XerC
MKNLDSTLKHYLLACRVEGFTPATILNHKVNLNKFVGFIQQEVGLTMVAQVTTDNVLGYLAGCADRGLSRQSIYDYHRDINRWFNWMVEQGILDKSPCRLIKAPKFTRKVLEVFTEAQIQKLILHCGDTFHGIRDKAVIIMLLDTGLRLKELSYLEIPDVNLDTGLIRVRMGKGQKERMVHFGKSAQLALVKYLTQREDTNKALWVTPGGLTLGFRGVQQLIRRLKVRTGITGVRVSPHTFRHTFAINYLRNGGDVFTLQSILGHSTLEMTKRYTSTLNQEDAIEKHKRFSPADQWRL